MSKKYKLFYLSQDFYNHYDKINYPEIEHKESRPYMVLLIKIENNTFAIPFRTNVKHNYCYKFKNTSRNTNSASGLDYSKAAIVNDENFLGARAVIDNKEYIELNNKYFFIIKQFTKYIDGYKKIINGTANEYDLKKYKYSTLKYFHSELGLVKSSPEKVFTYSRKQLKESADKVSASRNKNIERKKEKYEIKI